MVLAGHLCGRGGVPPAPSHRLPARAARHRSARPGLQAAAAYLSRRTTPLTDRDAGAVPDTRPIQPGSNSPSRTAGQPEYTRADLSAPSIPPCASKKRDTVKISVSRAQTVVKALFSSPRGNASEFGGRNCLRRAPLPCVPALPRGLEENDGAGGGNVERFGGCVHGNRHGFRSFPHL